MQHVFVSYSHRDNDFAQLLRTELHNAGIQSWLAQENLKAGEDWKEGIDDAIKKSFALVVIISPSSDQSKYVTYEWALAYGLGISIIPILYKNLESPQKLHPRLESLQYEDFTSNTNRPWLRIVTRLREIYSERARNDNLESKIVEAIQALSSWDSETIIRATEMLGRRKVELAVPELDKLLDEPDQSIQVAALEALGNIGYSQAVDKIIDLVNSKNEVRFAAIEALGKIGDLRAEKILLQQMNSGDYRTKIVSITALRNLPSSSSSFKDNLLDLLQSFIFEPEDSAWSEWDGDTVLSNVFNSLSTLVTKADTKNLTALLERENPAVVSGVLKLLSGLQDDASLPYVLKLARSDSRDISKAALSVLDSNESVVNYQELRDKLSSESEDSVQDSINFFYEKFNLEGLLYLLSYQQSKYYWQVSKKIGEVVSDLDFERLIEALSDPVDRVRGLSADVLGLKGVVQSCENLRLLIDDESPFVRGLAIRALGDLRCEKAIRLLKPRLKDAKRVFSNSTGEVRDFVAIALAKMKRKEALPRIQELIFDELSSLREEAIEVLIELGDIVDIQHFETMLNEGSLERRVSALRVLALLEKRIDISKIQEDINSENVDVKGAALESLSSLYPPLGLILSLTFRNIKSYWEIAEKIEKSLQPEHKPLVIQFLASEHNRVRAFLAYAVGLRPDLNFGECLVPLISDGVPFVRGLVIQALGELNYEPVGDALLDRLEDKEKIYTNGEARVCDYAAIALLNIKAHVSSEFLVSFRHIPFELMNKIFEVRRRRKVNVDRSFVLGLLKILEEGQDGNYLHTCCLRLIGEFGLPEDASPLLNYLSQSTGENWHAVEDAMIKIANTTIIPEVLSYLSNNNNHLLMACLDILEVHGNRSVVDKVLDLTFQSSVNSYVLFRAINVLSTHGDVSLLEVISRFSESEDDSVRCSVVKAYGRLKSEDNFSNIVLFLGDHSYVVRAAAVRALIALGDPNSLQVILRDTDILASSSDDYFKYEYDAACLEAIGKFGNEEHLPILRKVALDHENDDCRAASLKALSSLGDKDLLEISIKMLDDNGYSYEYDMPVNYLAAKILHEIDSSKAKIALDDWLLSLNEDEKLTFGNGS